jgi:hypothetical protein
VSRRGSASLIVALLAGLLWPGTIAAQVTQTVDFEGLAVGTALDQAYQSLGLSIPGARIDTFPRPQAGKQVARIVRTDNTQRLILTLVFATPQLTVRFYAGTIASQGAIVRGMARALDSLGKVIATQTMDTVSKGACSTPVILRTGTPSIRQVQVVFSTYNPNMAAALAIVSPDIAIDELSFTGLPLTPPPRQTHVPDLAKMTQAEAIVRLRDSGLQLKYEPNRPKLPGLGTVTHQAPPFGTPIAVGESVSITLGFVDTSSKPRPIYVPNLHGHTPNEADAILTKLHLVLDPNLPISADTGKPGTISDQKPLPKSPAKRGDTVHVFIFGKPSTPPPPPHWPWWLWAALGAAAAGGASAAARPVRRHLHRRRLKARLGDNSLEWRDSAPVEPARRVAELHFRVTLRLEDDDRAGPR